MSPGVILVGGMRSHQENYAAAFAEAGCRLLAVAVAPELDAAETARHAELALHLDLPLLPLGEALVLPGAAIASVCVGMRHRARVATLCADAGLHLYLDKPAGGSAADAAAIADAVRAAGVKAQVFSHLTTPWAGRARAALSEGRVGRLLAVHADMLMAKGRPSTPFAQNLRLEHARFADFEGDFTKHEMADMGIYPISLAASLIGGRALSVDAVTANHAFAEHLAADVEDYGAMLVSCENGVTASITCGRVGWQAWPRPYLARVVLVGDRDTLVFDSEPPQLTLTSSRGVQLPPANPLDPMEMWLSTRTTSRPRPAVSTIGLEGPPRSDAAAFLDVLAGGTQIGIGAEAAAHHCAILDAAYRSAVEGRAAAVA